MLTSVFDETWSKMIPAARRIFLHVTEKNKTACGIRARLNKQRFDIKTHLAPRNAFYGKEKIGPAKQKRRYKIKNAFTPTKN